MKKLFTGVLALGIAGQLMAKPWVQPELEETLKNNSNSHSFAFYFSPKKSATWAVSS